MATFILSPLFCMSFQSLQWLSPLIPLNHPSSLFNGLIHLHPPLNAEVVQGAIIGYILLSLYIVFLGSHVILVILTSRWCQTLSPIPASLLSSRKYLADNQAIPQPNFFFLLPFCFILGGFPSTKLTKPETWESLLITSSPSSFCIQSHQVLEFLYLKYFRSPFLYQTQTSCTSSNSLKHTSFPMAPTASQPKPITCPWSAKHSSE